MKKFFAASVLAALLVTPVQAATQLDTMSDASLWKPTDVAGVGSGIGSMFAGELSRTFALDAGRYLFTFDYFSNSRFGTKELDWSLTINPPAQGPVDGFADGSVTPVFRTASTGGNVDFFLSTPSSVTAVFAGVRAAVDNVSFLQTAPVPGPVAGAGLPLLLGFAYWAFRRRSA